ncbi:DUF4244 domain-containing protein [Propionicicella superfundia]|uniref:DUF4244 domain-containing protein n=1 Tax=Propionicicella superfundia TaxID=348582 RepID=UPI00041FBF57|nr:DUF4244 domain-containing protein [Propionicicella superfundia]
MTAVQKSPSTGLKLKNRRRDERGITTAEYAVGTVAAVSIVGVLLKIITTPEFSQILLQIIKWIVEIITGLVG